MRCDDRRGWAPSSHVIARAFVPVLVLAAVNSYALVLALGGLFVLVAAWVPTYLDRRPMSLPIVLVGLGAVLFAFPGLAPPDPRENLQLVEHFTEAGVIVALMGAGLALDRPVGWRNWSSTWRLLGIAMPLTIAGIALSGAWLLGLGLPAALLLGATLAPTDPVLAADVQVGQPTIQRDASLHAEDEVRFTLTSEAGLNDGLAFPFVYGAIALAANAANESNRSLLDWVLIDVGYRTVAGLVVGVVIGRLLGRLMFRPPWGIAPLAESTEGFLAVAATLLAYGVTELAHGYGFVAVFVAAVAIRSAERRHEVHRVMHDFGRQIEELLVVGLLILFGGTLVNGLLDGLTIGGVGVVILTLLVVRPLSGLLSMAGSGVPRPDKQAIAFFGVRGIGSLYYLAFALSRAPFDDVDALWPTVSFAILVSIVLHGITATPWMRRVDRHRRTRRFAAAADRASSVDQHN